MSRRFLIFNPVQYHFGFWFESDWLIEQGDSVNLLSGDEIEQRNDEIDKEVGKWHRAHLWDFLLHAFRY